MFACVSASYCRRLKGVSSPFDSRAVARDERGDEDDNGGMSNNTIEVTDEELTLIVSALRSYLYDFGHDEADLQRAIKKLIAKLPKTQKSA
jgi:spermidine/putrescine-binding protein